MKDGVVQQVDTPQNLYNKPVKSVRSRFYRFSADEHCRCYSLTKEGENLYALLSAGTYQVAVASG